MKEICLKCGSVLVSCNKKLKLNTTITTPIFIEGVLNEIKHEVQGMRKKAGYDIQDKIILCSDSTHLLNFDFIRNDVLAEDVFHGIHNGCDLVADICGIKVGIKKI